MRRKGDSYLHEALQILRYGLAGLVALAGMLCLCVVFFIVAVLIFGSFTQREEFKQQLDYAYHLDQQQFLQLHKPAFIFYRRHSPMKGNVVLVYAIDNGLRAVILQKAARSSSQRDDAVECVKPTIKKRWRGWHKTLHFVQPSPEYLSHHDYINHDSYYVLGSTEYLKQAVSACYMTFVRIPAAAAPEKYPNFKHSYWALSETENLLFSVYDTWH